jgi:hypothetical protein
MYRKDLEKTLGSLGLRQIFETYALPPRFLAYFSAQCAKDAMSKLKDNGVDSDPRSLAAISMAEDYGNGKDFSPEHMRKVTDDAATPAYAYCAYAAYYAANAANAAANATNAYAAAAYAAYAANAYYAAYAANADYYKPLFFALIESRLSKLEKILIFG